MSIFKTFFVTILLIVSSFALYFTIAFLLQGFNFDELALLVRHMYFLELFTTVIIYIIFLKILKVQVSIANIKCRLDKTVLFYIVIIVIGLSFFDRFFFDFSKIIDVIINKEIEPFVSNKKTNLTWVYRGTAALIIAPLFEELFFRKYIFGELLKKHSFATSAIVSSICFSLIHLPSYRNLIPTFIFGIICCLVYKKTKSVMYTIAFHFLSNFLWIIFSIFGEPFYTWLYRLEFNFLYWVFIVFGGLLSVFGIKKILILDLKK